MRFPFQECYLLICPICDANLVRVNAVLRCASGHCFDIARVGYVNLLLAPQRGDSKPMLAARRQFLDSGHYAPLANAINECIATYMQQHPASGSAGYHMLDAGCGEGYYLAQLRQHIAAHSRTQCVFYGMDVSKDAMTMASRRCPDMCWFVADLKQKICVPDQSMQVLLNVFAPRNAREFARISASGGLLLIVIPSAQHLQELRETYNLLGIAPRKQQRIEEQFTPAFKLFDIHTCEYILRLSATAVRQVIMMTPNYWRASEDVYKLAEKSVIIETRAAFTLLLFRRT